MIRLFRRKTTDESTYLEKRRLLRAFFGGTRILQSLVLLLLLLDILILYALFLGSQGLLGYRQQDRQVAEMATKVRKLKEDNHRLFRRIQGFKSDFQAQQRLVREYLGWTRENEIVLEFPQTSKDSR
jgi:cell division protein FtsB